MRTKIKNRIFYQRRTEKCEGPKHESTAIGQNLLPEPMAPSTQTNDSAHLIFEKTKAPVEPQTKLIKCLESDDGSDDVDIESIINETINQTMAANDSINPRNLILEKKICI